MKYYEIDFSIAAPEAQLQDARDLLAAFLGEVGFETFDETEGGLLGYVQQAFFDQTALDDTLAEFPMDDVTIGYAVAEAEDKDWNEVWENEGFEPIVVNDRIIVHDGRHLPEMAATANGTTPIMIEIDAKMAFGTGTHETTRMVVAALSDTALEGKTLLDCGCGTGILGIAALKMGARLAVGYDIDEWSVENARHNAVINGILDDSYSSLLGDATVVDTILEGTKKSGNDKFDIVVANINRNILLADMPQFVKALKPGGVLILSGFYTEDAAMLIDKASSLNLHHMRTASDNNWACVVLEG